MNKEKLAKIKNRIKEHAPEIILSLTAVAAAAYAISVRKTLSEEEKRFPKTDETRLALNGESMELLNKGTILFWTVEDHKISLAYDPDC